MKIDVLRDIEPFIDNIDRGIGEAKIKRKYLNEIDHVCYRVKTHAQYERLVRQLLADEGFVRPVGEPAMINGRPIATFQFVQPVEATDWIINYLEVPAPKQGSPYEEGLEHAEFVVLGGDLTKFEAAHSHLAPYFNRGGMNKSINPELGLRAFGVSIKFHELSLGKVVRIEQGLDEHSQPEGGNHITR